MANNKITVDQMRERLGQQRIERESVGQIKPNEDGTYELYNTTLKELGKAVAEDAGERLKPELAKSIIKQVKQESTALGEALQVQLNETEEKLLALAQQARPIEVITEKKRQILKGTQHKNFDKLLTVVGSNLPALLVGPAGTGKSYAGEKIAESFDLPFYAISVGSQTSKSDLVGYNDANGNYRETQFRQAYENGGVFLLDEADAGNSNVLILLNAALANGQMAFPDKMVKRNDDFRIIGTANTFGYGASRQYVGRNQLDAATLDRFVVIDWDIDDIVEKNMAGEQTKWLAVVRAVRKRVVEELDLRVVISPRATQRGAKLLDAGMTFDAVLPIALTGNIPAGEKQALENLARTVWDRA